MAVIIVFWCGGRGVYIHMWKCDWCNVSNWQMPSGTRSLYWFCAQFWHSGNEHIILRAEWDAYISVELRGVSVSHSKPRKFSNLDLIRPEVCQCWSEHIQTAATLTQQSFSMETQPSQETQTGSPTECLMTWTTSTVEDGNCRLLKTDVNTEQAQTHLHKWMSSHTHRSLALLCPRCYPLLSL